MSIQVECHWKFAFVLFRSRECVILQSLQELFCFVAVKAACSKQLRRKALTDLPVANKVLHCFIRIGLEEQLRLILMAQNPSLKCIDLFHAARWIIFGVVIYTIESPDNLVDKVAHIILPAAIKNAQEDHAFTVINKNPSK